MTKVRFLEDAREEFLEAFHRYRSVRRQLGSDFAREVERSAGRAAGFPEHGTPYLEGTRRLILHRFPYSLVYRSSPEEVVIAAVAHHRRKPGYWADRLK